MTKIRKNSRGAVCAAMLVVGLIVLIVGIAFSVKLAVFNSNSATVEATIVEIYTYYNDDSTEHRVFVSYEVDGVTYSHRELGSYSSSMREGKTVKIKYNLDNPNEIMSKSSVFIPVILLPLGGIFMGLAIWQLTIIRKRRGMSRRLLKNGVKVLAVVVSIDPDLTTSVNGRYPYSTALCRYDDKGRTIDFRSESGAMNGKLFPGDRVAVYFDAADPTQYCVDLKDVVKGNGYIPPVQQTYGAAAGQVESGLDGIIWSDDTSVPNGGTDYGATTQNTDYAPPINTSADGYKLPDGDDDLFD